MSTRMMVDGQSRLKEISIQEDTRQPAFIRSIAKLISWIFHPVFIPVYVSWFLVYNHPYLFSGFKTWDKTIIIIQFVVTYAFIPVITILLLKALGFINSIYLKTQRDRIIPYIVCGIFYFSIWYVMKNQLNYPFTITVFAKAVFFASCAGLMANIYQKVSMHSIAAGVMTTFIALLAFTDGSNLIPYLSISLFVAGLVCTSRLIVSDHRPKEIYTGFLIGMAAQLVAWWL